MISATASPFSSNNIQLGNPTAKIDERGRYLLVSTPRAGNTWLRRMLATCLRLHDFAVHRAQDIDWPNLPPGVIVQLHWRYTASFLSMLNAHDIKPITICRHPLDVLISILHFCRHEPETAQWLNGEGGSEQTLIGKSPLTPEFHDYVLSKRAKALLEVSQEWAAAGSVCVRYEDLVEAGRETLRSLLSPSYVTEECLHLAIEANSIANLRRTSSNYHYWQGKPGLWTSLIGRLLAEEVAREHRPVFERFGYDVDAALMLDEDSVLQSWERLAAPHRRAATAAASY